MISLQLTDHSQMNDALNEISTRLIVSSIPAAKVQLDICIVPELGLLESSRSLKWKRFEKNTLSKIQGSISRSSMA